MLTKTLFSRGNDNPCEAYVKQKHTLTIRQDSSHYKPNILGSAFSACVESAKVGLGNVVTSTKQAWCALGMLSMVLTKRTCEKNSEKGGSSCTSVTLVGVGLMSGAMLAEPEAVAMGGLQSSLKTALANSQLVQEGRYSEFGAVVAHSSVIGGLKEAVKEVVYDSICNVAEAVGGELLAEVVSPGIDAVLMATSVLRKLKVEESPAVVETDPSCAGNKDVVVLSAKEVVECKRTKELAQRTCVSIMSKGTGIAVCIIAGPAGGIVAATMAKYFLPKFF